MSRHAMTNRGITFYMRDSNGNSLEKDGDKVDKAKEAAPASSSENVFVTPLEPAPANSSVTVPPSSEAAPIPSTSGAVNRRGPPPPPGTWSAQRTLP